MKSEEKEIVWIEIKPEKPHPFLQVAGLQSLNEKAWEFILGYLSVDDIFGVLLCNKYCYILVKAYYYSQYTMFYHNFAPYNINNIYTIANYCTLPNTVQGLHSLLIYSISNIY